MKYISVNQISEEERQSILSKHREPYNGYKTLNPHTNNEQPLYVQDYTLDKQGVTLNNKGEVKGYTNFRINEGHSMDQCEQCSGEMREGECMECGWKMEEIGEDFTGRLKKAAEKFKETISGKKKGKGTPYTAEAVADIIKHIQSSKTEKQLESALKMFDNLLDTNEDVKEVYKERIKNAFKRKADELDHYYKDKDSKKNIKEYQTGKLEDIYNVSDLSDTDEFDYVEGDDNYQGSFEQMHKLPKLKTEATSNAPLSYGKHYNSIKDAYDFKSNGPVGDGGTLRQKSLEEQNPSPFIADRLKQKSPYYEFGKDGITKQYEKPQKIRRAASNVPSPEESTMTQTGKLPIDPYNKNSQGQYGPVDLSTKKTYKITQVNAPQQGQKKEWDDENIPFKMNEQTVGGGNAPDFDIDWEDPAYNFKSKGPKEDTYTEKASDMDLDNDKVKEPYNFESGGSENGGDVYPVNEDGECEECWEKMESAFSDGEIEEEDISGVQGMYGDMDPAYNFVSTGAGKGGPYQTSDFPQGYSGENEDAYWELEPGELDPDKIDREASWEEITASTGEDELSHLDEEKIQKIITQKNKINEMMLRMTKFN